MESFIECLPDGKAAVSTQHNDLVILECIGNLVLWSSFSEGGYTIGVVRSPSGQLLGPWQQDIQPFYSDDGGHCMTFHDLDGNPWLSVHRPNDTPNEHPIFLPLAEEKLRHL